MAQRPNVASTDELAGKIQPVILGADYSCYAYVRAFWEAYHVRSIIYAGSDIKSISRTKFADYRVEEGVDSEDVLVPLLKRVGDQLCVEGRVPFLVTCGDFYARIVSKHKQELERWFCTPVVDFDVLDFVTQKQNFYEVCEQVCMAYPKTRFLKKVGYNGICCFDAKYDARDGSYRFLKGQCPSRPQLVARAPLGHQLRPDSGGRRRSWREPDARGAQGRLGLRGRPQGRDRALYAQRASEGARAFGL